MTPISNAMPYLSIVLLSLEPNEQVVVGTNVRLREMPIVGWNVEGDEASPIMLGRRLPGETVVIHDMARKDFTFLDAPTRSGVWTVPSLDAVKSEVMSRFLDARRAREKAIEASKPAKAKPALPGPVLGSPDDAHWGTGQGPRF